MAKYSPDQYAIDFTSPTNDARRMLDSALKQTCGAKLEHWEFLWWTYNIETRSDTGLVKTAEEIGERLWCHPKTVRRITAFLVDQGLIRVTERRAYTGSQQANEYRINWEGAKRLHDTARRNIGLGPSSTEGQTAPGGERFVPPPPQSVQGGERFVPHTKETLPLLNLYETSGTDRSPADPILEKGNEGTSGLLTAPAKNRLLLADLPELPELTEGAKLLIASLPPNTLALGAFDPIEIKHLDDTKMLIEWHQRQLSIESPVVGNTEAHLLLVIAAGLSALRYKGTITSSRVALFVSTVWKANWRPVLRNVREARKRLDERAALAGKAYWREKLTLETMTEGSR